MPARSVRAARKPSRAPVQPGCGPSGPTPAASHGAGGERRRGRAAPISSLPLTPANSRGVSGHVRDAGRLALDSVKRLHSPRQPPSPAAR